MKKRILVGLIISATVLFLTPLLPTVQFSKAQEATEQAIYEDMNLMIVDSIRIELRAFEDIKPEFLATVIALFSESSFLQKYLAPYDGSGGDDPQPLCFPFLGIFVYGLIAFLILQILGYIFGFVFKNLALMIRTIVNNITSSIGNIIVLIIKVIFFFGQLLVAIFQGIYTLLSNAGTFIGTAIVALISAIISAILFILNVLVSIVQGIWLGFGTFLGLILAILKLIYDTIFPSTVFA